MRYVDFLRISTLASGVVSTVLILSAALRFDFDSQRTLWLCVLLWWAGCLLLGVYRSRSLQAHSTVRKLVEKAEKTHALPAYTPESLLVSRLLPITLVAMATTLVGWVFNPLIPAFVAGFVLFHTLQWRHQPAAVAAIQARDNVTFYIREKSMAGRLQLSCVAEVSVD